MDRGWRLRLTVLLGLCALAVYLLFASYRFYFAATPEQQADNVAFCKSLPRWASCAKLNLGLDLQGGVHLVMGVRVDKAIEHRLDRLGDGLRDMLKQKEVDTVGLERHHGAADMILTTATATGADAAERITRRELPMLQMRREAATRLRLQLTDEEAVAVRDAAVEQSIKTIRNRADKLGVTEPTIARRGTDSILIQLPGVKDPQHAIDIIGRTAQLEFNMVDVSSSAHLAAVPTEQLPEGVVRRQVGGGRAKDRQQYFELPEAQQAAVQALLTPHVPDGRALMFGAAQTASGVERPGYLRTYLVQARPDITGEYLVNAQVQQNHDVPGDYYVTMTFDAVGARVFEKLTADNVGRNMAIVLDGKVSSAPMIQEKIGGGTARITLGRSGDARAKFQEAKDLALVLKAGALPAPVEVREKRQVGKTLGHDTVARGTFAMGLGTLLVVVFMALYYRGSGMMANAALALNMLFMFAFLAACEATLTLPGMAGIVLTIGMAVDANVLIFERIREELRHGKSPKLAIDAGYKKAFSSIFDSNVTTVIAGLVLMQYGSGPVRGFAVTLIIGLGCSLYTAIVVTRLIYDWLIRYRPLTSLSI